MLLSIKPQLNYELTVSRSPFLAVCCRWGQKNPRSLGETHVIGKKEEERNKAEILSASTDREDTIMWHHLVRGSTCNGNSQARQNYNL